MSVKMAYERLRGWTYGWGLLVINLYKSPPQSGVGMGLKLCSIYVMFVHPINRSWRGHVAYFIEAVVIVVGGALFLLFVALFIESLT